MPRIPTGTTHLFLISYFLFLFLFFEIVGLIDPMCPNTMEVKTSQGKFSLRMRGRNLSVQKRSSVCVHEFH